MVYFGKIKGGVVVFDQTPPLRDGTTVRVEPDSQAGISNVKSLLEWRGEWSGTQDELEKLLGEVQEMRDADLTD